MANDVTFQRADYQAALPAWSLISDVCAGERAVKAKTTAYLPRPNPLDTSAENAERYTQYLARAVFYGVTARTLAGLTGAAFRKWPALDVPGALGYIADDVDGAGVSVYQQAQACLAQALKIGRHALLVDYPRVDAPASRADMASGRMQATITGINAEQVINWRVEKQGAQHRLMLVVISETQQAVTADGFGLEEVPQYRVLRLSDAGYTQEIWRAPDRGTAWEIVDGPFLVLDGAGRAWDEIPFTFVGSVNNDAGIDPAPLYDLACLNIAHYRNSADYEDSAYFVGQAQPWMAGLSEEWRDWLQQTGIFVGSRAPILLPEGGQFGIAQAAPNTLAKEAMDQKEAQMVALGARLVQPGSAIKTATEAQGELEAEHSVLSLVCSNVSEAYSRALGWMARFMGAEGDATLTLTQDFVAQRLDSAMLAALVAAVQGGQMSFDTFWRNLQRGDLADGEVDAELERERIMNNLPMTGGIDGGQ